MLFVLFVFLIPLMLVNKDYQQQSPGLKISAMYRSCINSQGENDP